ncbi:MAG TPA: carboxypeptidase-like regulatory domain-containing protein, partial [Gillisia sp.]|nr:carboxypeptidase-like regulatory domain-containing protein [Gillisia sp.]
MSNFRFYFLFSLVLISSDALYSQTYLTGYVYSAIDSTAVPGVSVYFDGTSTGVSTTDEGYFSISLANETTSPLVVSSVGYQTTFIPRSSQQTTQPIIIYLKESEESLGEVFLETDPWSRKKKLDIFRKEFLGKSMAASECMIENENALRL